MVNWFYSWYLKKYFFCFTLFALHIFSLQVGSRAIIIEIWVMTWSMRNVIFEVRSCFFGNHYFDHDYGDWNALPARSSIDKRRFCPQLKDRPGRRVETHNHWERCLRNQAIHAYINSDINRVSISRTTSQTELLPAEISGTFFRFSTYQQGVTIRQRYVPTP